MALPVLGDDMSLTRVKEAKLTLKAYIINCNSKAAIW